MNVDIYDIEKLPHNQYRVEYSHKGNECTLLVEGKWGTKFLLELHDRVVYLKAHNICPQVEVVKQTEPNYDRYGNIVGGL